MNRPSGTEQRRLRQGLFEVPVRWAGRGRPLVYLHDAWGALTDLELPGALSRLAEHYLVLEPSHPGFDGATGLEHLEDPLDLALYYLDFLDELMVDSPHVVGHGLGGMIAAEMASLAPERVAKLVLMSPYGLWLEGAPAADILSLTEEELSPALWADPSAAPVLDRDADEALQRRQNLAAAAKFLWPIPEHGLRKRLHRLRAPTLLLWGERDGVVPPVYGEAFRQRLAVSNLVTIPGAAHFPHLEQPQAFSRTVLEFLQG